MPATPQVQSALDELQRRGVAVNLPDAGQVAGASIQTLPQTPATQVTAADVTQYASGAQPEMDYSSPREVERQLRLKQMKGQLAVQDTINELQRRGVNLKLATQPAEEEITKRAATEAVENARKEGDPEAFKQAWRQLFPGKALPRVNGQIDYATGQDDIDVEIDRRKKLEAAKVGVHNVVEQKVTRTNPQTGKDEEYLVRIDKVTGQKLGETLLSENQKPLTESQAGAKMFSARMESNENVLQGIESKGFQPTSIGTTAQGFLPNRFKSGDVQAYNAAKQNWIAAVLRKESGAAISSKEYSDADKQYFPQDGDAKEVVKQKQQLRLLAQSQMREAIGPHAGASGAVPGAPASPAAGSSPAASAPVPVKTAAEAPPTAKFIISPKGRTYRNPKYTGP